MIRSMRFIVILVCLMPTILMGQRVVDSLQNELEGASGRLRIDLLNEIGMKSVFNDPQLALKYSALAVKESRELNYHVGEIKGTYVTGIVYDIKGTTDSSEYYFRKGYAISKDGEYRELEGDGLNNLGMMYWNKGYFEQALSYFLEALRMYEEIGLHAGISKAVSNIGLIYQELNRFRVALLYNFRSLEMRIEKGNADHISRSYNNIGICYKNLGMLDSAEFYYRKGLEFARIDDAKQVEASILDNLGNIYNLLQDHDQAIEYYQESLKTNGSVDNFQTVATYNNLSSLYNEIGEYSKALHYAHNSHRLIASGKVLGHSSETYKNKADAYLRLNFPDSAQKYYELWGIVKDSIYGEKSAKAVAEMQTRYETEKKEQEIDVLQAETELQALELKHTRYIALAIAVLAAFSILAVALNSSRKRYKMRAEVSAEKEQLQKTRFKAVIDAEENERKRIARELHDGLGQLLSTTRLMISSMDDEEENPKIQNSLKLIDTAVHEVRSISHNMMPNALAAYGLEVALNDLVRKINLAGMIQVSLSINADMQFNESQSIALYRVVQEVLNNAIKYSKASEINIFAHEVGGALMMTITDNGVGFDTNSIHSSSGIGWNNLYSRMELIGGEISVFSRINEGTTVRVSAPFTHNVESLAS